MKLRRLLALSLLLSAAACDRDEPRRHRPPALADADYGKVPAMSLRDHTGAAFDGTWLDGKVTVVDFIFTRCDTICPGLTMEMVRFADRTADVADRVQLASFSVDPKYDTPEVLAAYAGRFGADAARWRFVTGDYPEVQRIVEQALMTAMDEVGQTPSGAPDIRHGGHFLLVDRDRTIRGVYDSSEPGRLEQLARDARTLAQR